MLKGRREVMPGIALLILLATQLRIPDDVSGNKLGCASDQRLTVATLSRPESVVGVQKRKKAHLNNLKANINYRDSSRRIPQAPISLSAGE